MLNPATLIFMGFVLGWNWTALRSVVGVVLVFGIAYLGNRFVRPDDVPSEAHQKLAALDAADDSGASVSIRWLILEIKSRENRESFLGSKWSRRSRKRAGRMLPLRPKAARIEKSSSALPGFPHNIQG